jgi:tRNA G46 methylase TrmB
MSCSTEARSPAVVTNQSDTHDALVQLVDKHARSRYSRPVSAHQQACFDELDQRVATHGGPVILDSGCGVGESTCVLASRHPAHLVIGIDKSAVRIERALSRASSTSALIARGDCVDIWRLAAHAQWPVTHHYLLYPNPWPKAKHLQRRWHAHPVLPALIELGGRLELRTNWLIYAREFELALTRFGIATAPVEALPPDTAITPFERKYRASGHPLYRLTCDLPTTARRLTGGRG